MTDETSEATGVRQSGAPQPITAACAQQQCRGKNVEKEVEWTSVTSKRAQVDDHKWTVLGAKRVTSSTNQAQQSTLCMDKNVEKQVEWTSVTSKCAQVDDHKWTVLGAKRAQAQQSTLYKAKGARNDSRLCPSLDLADVPPLGLGERVLKLCEREGDRPRPRRLSLLALVHDALLSEGGGIGRARQLDESRMHSMQWPDDLLAKVWEFVRAGMWQARLKNRLWKDIHHEMVLRAQLKEFDRLYNDAEVSWSHTPTSVTAYNVLSRCKRVRDMFDADNCSDIDAPYFIDGEAHYAKWSMRVHTWQERYSFGFALVF